MPGAFRHTTDRYVCRSFCIPALHASNAGNTFCITDIDGMVVCPFNNILLLQLSLLAMLTLQRVLARRT